MAESRAADACVAHVATQDIGLTPHAAFYSRESLEEMKRRAAEAVTAALADETGSDG
jgi:phosphoglycerate dehydrogenase-like enzyme